MPRFYKEYGRGYDLDRELPFCDVPDVGRVQLGTAGSYIMVCKTCGDEHFREQMLSYCFNGHGKMVPLTFELGDELRPMLEEQGITFTTVEQRKAKRLEEEKARPWNWVFGDKTEADFPLGYVKVAAARAS